MIFKTKDGKIEVSKYLPDGTRLRKRVPNKNIGKALLARIEEALVMGTWRELLAEINGKKPERYTIKDFAEKFLEAYAKTRMRSWKRYALSLRHIVRHLGNVILNEFTRRHAHEFAELRKRELSEKTPSQTVTAATVNRDLACLKKMLSYALDVGAIEAHPMTRFRLLPVQEVEIRVPDADQVRALIDATGDRSIRAYLAFVAETGVRKMEALRLEWNQVNFASRTLAVAGETKSKKVRYVPLSKVAVEALNSLPRFISTQRVFVNPRTKKPWSNPEKVFRTARRRTDMTWLTIHCLRHFRISEWVRAGIDLRTVQQLAGHANITTTMRYAHFAPSSFEQVRRIIDMPVAQLA